MTTKTINKHKQEYWHIPKFSILPLLGLILFVLLAIGNFQLIDKDVIKEVFNCEENNCNLQTSDLIIIYPTIGEYILISLALISLVALFKRGYSKLKSYEEDGLIHDLIIGSTFGLIGGLFVGLILGLISGLIGGLIAGLIGGLIVGLIEELSK